MNGDVPFFTAPASAYPVQVPTDLDATPVVSARHWRRRLVIAASCTAVALVTAAAGLTVFVRHPNTQPVVLPKTLDGIPLATGNLNFGAASGPNSWRESVRGDLHGNAFDGAGFGHQHVGEPLLNLTVARTDLTGLLDLRLGAPPYIREGQVTCTQTFDVRGAAERTAKSQGRKFDATGYSDSPTLLEHWVLCSRTSDDLSVSVLAMFVSTDRVGEVASAVDQVWDAQ